MLLALTFSTLCALLTDDGQKIDVAVVVGGPSAGKPSSTAAVLDAVRAAVVVAARERDLGLIDLLAHGLEREWNSCLDLGCRRALATRRGAEWHIAVNDGDDVELTLLAGPTSLASVQVQGSRFAQPGRIPAAVDALLEQVRPRAQVQRLAWLKQARDHRRHQDLPQAAAAYGRAFALVVDDRAVEVAFSWARLLEEMGENEGCDAVFDTAQATLLPAAAPLSASARARFVSGWHEHLWGRARLLSDIADADTGPDHEWLSAQAFAAWQRVSTAAALAGGAGSHLSKRAAEEAGRYGIDAAIHEAKTSTLEPESAADDSASAATRLATPAALAPAPEPAALATPQPAALATPQPDALATPQPAALPDTSPARSDCSADLPALTDPLP